MTDDELIADLERFERGEIPSRFGELTLTLPRRPVSQQARRARKEQLGADLQAALSKYQFILTGDVKLELEWSIHERLRYESDEGADVDNILKPTLDAITGPTGILIDDCQVQAVTSYWIDWPRDDQQLTIRLKHEADAFMSRSSLAFVDLGKNLYMPVNAQLPQEQRRAVAEILMKAVEVRDELEASGVDFFTSRMIMPAQRVFHRSRLGAHFKLGSINAYKDGTLL